MFRFDTGGLENGVANLINHMPPDAYRHAVISLTSITDFRRRILNRDVQFIALEKPSGHAIWMYPQLFQIFRKLRPSIVHSRNLAALEVVVPAWAAGVPVRIHGEHGRDVGDLDGSNRKYQWVRRAYRPFVNRYVALSKDLDTYLTCRVGIHQTAVAQIYNGVDLQHFAPCAARVPIAGCPFSDPSHFIFGTVGRMQTVKDQTLLARAFILTLQRAPELRTRLRLVMVGDGPLRAEARQLLDAAGVSDLAWLPGERTDIPEVLRGLDVFVLPSLAEGISNTILEAMASGLPVIATRVGGNPELLTEDKTGLLVPAADEKAMAAALLAYARDPERARAAGQAGRADVERRFSLQGMVSAYRDLYDRLLETKTCAA